MYLDSAILVKLFVKEPDSLFYANLVHQQEIVSSAIAFTEVWSAMLTKERLGELSQKECLRAWNSGD